MAAVTWAFAVVVFIAIAGAAYLAVSAHWRCDEIERRLATDTSHGRHRGEK